MMPVTSVMSFMPNVYMPQDDVGRLYALQEQLWDGRDRKSEPLKRDLRVALDQSIRDNEVLIQPVMQKVMTDTYDRMIINGAIPADRKPQSDELALRLSAALTMLLNSDDLERWITEKPLNKMLQGSEAEYRLRLMGTTDYSKQTWLA